MVPTMVIGKVVITYHTLKPKRRWYTIPKYILCTYVPFTLGGRGRRRFVAEDGGERDTHTTRHTNTHTQHIN